MNELKNAKGKQPNEGTNPLQTKALPKGTEATEIWQAYGDNKY
jgi:hypothetical protein